MIKATIMYPTTDGSTFNMDYYTNQHVAIVHDLLDGRGLKGVQFESGLFSLDGSSPAYQVIGGLLFESLELFKKAMDEVGSELIADIAKFSSVQPIIQVSRFSQGV